MTTKQEWISQYYREHHQLPNELEINRAILMDQITVPEPPPLAQNITAFFSADLPASPKTLSHPRAIYLPVMLLLLIVSFIGYGMTTTRSEDDLKAAYTQTLATKDAKALVELLVPEQADSPFALAGATAFLSDVHNGAENTTFSAIKHGKAAFKITTTTQLGLFKTHNLRVNPTYLKVPAHIKTPIYYQQKRLSDADLAAPLIYGQYRFQTDHNRQEAIVKAGSANEANLYFQPQQATLDHVLPASIVVK